MNGTGGESATGILRAEHRQILLVVDALADELDTLETGSRPDDTQRLSDCVEFFRLYADACHHAKEENLLFHELEDAGMPGDQGPIAVMLEEHRQARALVAVMAEALAAGTAAGAVRHTFRTAAFAYIDLIRSHIGKEDGILFEIADGMIRGPRCGRLCAAYGEADGCRFESRTKADLEALAARIAAHRP